MAEQQSGFFSGLKKILFKEDPTVLPDLTQPENKASEQKIAEERPSAGLTPDVPSDLSLDEQTSRKAYQLIESMNQPGVDFFEVWNAAEENGGASGANIKAAFNALKFADKSLTKEKVLHTGNYYCTELQKALDNDLAKKTEERQTLQAEKQKNRETLSNAVNNIEKQINELQVSLAEKQKELKELDSKFEPRIAAIEQKTEAGKRTISGIISKMRNMIAVAEKEL